MENAELISLREQVKKLEQSHLKLGRRRTVAFGMIAIAALIAAVYGFVLQEESARCREQAAVFEQLALQRTGEALTARDQAEAALLKVEALTIELEICRAVKK